MLLSALRWHARLHKEDQAWMVPELGSTNGTRLNGWLVIRGAQIRPGDQVSLGMVTYVTTDGPAA
ncbi:MAG TPA: FHA domain-containing protein [Streptosporangiaceae bacterium]|nr:FHA domain-containing protein [Streptosporangiaceae bacterium]